MHGIAFIGCIVFNAPESLRGDSILIMTFMCITFHNIRSTILLRMSETVCEVRLETTVRPTTNWVKRWLASVFETLWKRILLLHHYWRGNFGRTLHAWNWKTVSTVASRLFILLQNVWNHNFWLNTIWTRFVQTSVGAFFGCPWSDTCIIYILILLQSYRFVLFLIIVPHHYNRNLKLP